MLAPAGKIIRGGALGMLKETLVGGSTRPARQRRQTQSRKINSEIRFKINYFNFSARGKNYRFELI